ncbi:hypothetical protein ElyMa_003049900 [Elysia marginata]|uniref:Uncharacterized protein n=1 Tax=Elysia marginata TaxID=1093978 RepID=A0AAV4INA6_9GAST|nr:hypothetical protein ElyMa_003049900 [Elysia marginata]
MDSVVQSFESVGGGHSLGIHRNLQLMDRRIEYDRQREPRRQAEKSSRAGLHAFYHVQREITYGIQRRVASWSTSAAMPCARSRTEVEDPKMLATMSWQQQ